MERSIVDNYEMVDLKLVVDFGELVKIRHRGIDLSEGDIDFAKFDDDLWLDSRLIELVLRQVVQVELVKRLVMRIECLVVVAVDIVDESHLVDDTGVVGNDYFDSVGRNELFGIDCYDRLQVKGHHFHQFP
jgi:hypothetical protein